MRKFDFIIITFQDNDVNFNSELKLKIREMKGFGVVSIQN